MTQHSLYRLALTGLLGAALLTAGCSNAPLRDSTGHSTPAVTGQPSARHAARQRVVDSALATLGTPYRWGGNRPDGFDCSGLVQYSHATAGIRVPRVTAQQRRHARPVALARLRPGDLLFFRTGDKGRHVGIYLGRGEFIHAPSSGKRVSLASLDNPYWRARLVGAGSYL